VSLLKDNTSLRDMARKSIISAKDYTYAKAAEKWEEMILQKIK